MNFIFKFYLKKRTNANNVRRVVLEAFEGQEMQHYVGRSILKGIYLEPEMVQFEIFEVIFCANTLSIRDIRGIEGDSIRPEVIKHANDVNNKTAQDLKEIEKNSELKPCITLDQIQDIIDTSSLYGQNFLKQLMNLLEDFPIIVEKVKVEETDSAAFVRKVSKG